MTDYVRCEVCGSCINIDTGGYLIECACGAVAVDGNEYFTRILGNEGTWTLHKE